MKAQIEEQLSSVKHVDAANHQVSEFQLAVDKASDGKFKEALAMIDALLPTITEPELLSAAKDFREEGDGVHRGDDAEEEKMSSASHYFF